MLALILIFDLLATFSAVSCFINQFRPLYAA